MADRVCHFEIHADDPEKAIAFYGGLFGWEFTRWEGGEYWLIRTGPDGEPGINGGLVRRMGPRPGDAQPVSSFVCTVMVAALDDLLVRVGGAGGLVVVPKMAIKGVGWLAYAKDSQGNVFGMMQRDPSAA
jgi:predicted enzyme related to lactoylglutathione lyase